METGIEPVCTVLQTVASPLGHSTAGDCRLFDSTNEVLGADDETRTRDPHLGKVMRYQLRYIRITFPELMFFRTTLALGLAPITLADNKPLCKIACSQVCCMLFTNSF